MACKLSTSDGLLYVCPIHGTTFRLPAPRWIEIMADCETHREAEQSLQATEQATRQGAAGPGARPTTEALLELRYTQGRAKVPREVADARLETCREDCDAHFRDCLGLDRCKRCVGCQGRAALFFVRRIAGELAPVDACLWAE